VRTQEKDREGNNENQLTLEHCRGRWGVNIKMREHFKNTPAEYWLKYFINRCGGARKKAQPLHIEAEKNDIAVLDRPVRSSATPRSP
jgi:hypothetical protein